jgi:hypothetical protein
MAVCSVHEYFLARELAPVAIFVLSPVSMAG